MKALSYASNREEIDQLHLAHVEEVILCSKLFSKMIAAGDASLESVLLLAQYAKNKAMRVLFEWDILMDNAKFNQCIKLLENISLEDFYAIRVKDSGALEYCLQKYPKLKIQLLCEHNNHNLGALKRWEQYIGPRLDRIIISPEISASKIPTLKANLKCDLELLGLGRILLFYSPRELLSPWQQLKPTENEYNALVTSEESPHKGFPLIQNVHGTFMYNTKLLSLVSMIDDMQLKGVDYFRIDLRQSKLNIERNENILNDITLLISHFDAKLALDVEQRLNDKFNKGFYQINKTDVLLKKLKNSNSKNRGEKHIGEVLEVIKNKHIAILIQNSKRSLKTKDAIILHTPDGKIKSLCLATMWNSTLQEVAVAVNEELIFIPHVGGVSVKTTVYFNEDSI